MWNIPSKERLAKIPRLYETEKVPIRDKLIHLHFFVGGCDWYIAEFDGDDLFWGFAILHSDYEMAEWGYISFSELKSIEIDGWLEIDCELEEYWKVCKASDIEKIRLAQGWPEDGPPREDSFREDDFDHEDQGRALPEHSGSLHRYNEP